MLLWLLAQILPYLLGSGLIVFFSLGEEAFDLLDHVYLSSLQYRISNIQAPPAKGKLQEIVVASPYATSPANHTNSPLHKTGIKGCNAFGAVEPNNQPDIGLLQDKGFSHSTLLLAFGKRLGLLPSFGYLTNSPIDS
ncbi:Uncharacterized protein TCM_011177 [Theobroma cacao]|uniref:Uncharacterized protein n=1 Tax=Theobroma cacao TaxID=3641 RepID=A0A061E9F0_THECC|nr:Uncharacterized protein TCM_011177 [Theobroma cacao]